MKLSNKRKKLQTLNEHSEEDSFKEGFKEELIERVLDTGLITIYENNITITLPSYLLNKYEIYLSSSSWVCKWR
jgi:hypothetical protein